MHRPIKMSYSGLVSKPRLAPDAAIANRNRRLQALVVVRDAEDSLILGEGATWIWNLVSEHFYTSHQLVDWYHAAEHLANAAKVLYGEDTSVPALSASLEEYFYLYNYERPYQYLGSNYPPTSILLLRCLSCDPMIHLIFAGLWS